MPALSTANLDEIQVSLHEMNACSRVIQQLLELLAFTKFSILHEGICVPRHETEAPE